MTSLLLPRQPEPHQDIVDCIAVTVLRQRRFREGPIELGLQFGQPGLMERPIQTLDRGVLAADLPGDQLVQEREAEVVVEPRLAAALSMSVDVVFPALPQAVSRGCRRRRPAATACEIPGVRTGRGGRLD